MKTPSEVNALTTTLITTELLENSHVQLPEEQHSNFNPDLVVAFRGLAAAFSDMVEAGRRRSFPNAMLIANFPPTGRTDRLPFIAAWGKKTEYPLPRDYKVADYFSSRERMIALMRHKSLHRTTLDARGFLGYLASNRDESGVYARVLYGVKFNQLHYTEYEGLTSQNSHILLSNVMNYIRDAGPLRFHAGVKYWPHTRYISNEFARDSQHGLIDQI